mmetsp:Transcript_3777/g.7921  ORF Transcript_3777/g.7921 Transcript_3777/m.7921 type:complete len:460 (+) Transcript_3777:103-1482(+)
MIVSRLFTVRTALLEKMRRHLRNRILGPPLLLPSRGPPVLRIPRPLSSVSAPPPESILSLAVRRANRSANRAARAAAAAVRASGGANSAGQVPSAVTTNTLWSSALCVPAGLIGWYVYSMDDPDSIPIKTLRATGATSLWNNMTEDYVKPSREKALPDWPMPNVPQDLACPHTLVLDLEKTLVCSSWDRKHGWRHAKRPGVDKFLQKMSQYYEIVLFTPSIRGVAEEVTAKLDPQGLIMHHLFREATHLMDGVHVKDLDTLNRNVRRIVAIDTNPEALKLHPDNLIRIKPFDDPTDVGDDALEKITPILLEIAQENYENIPKVLRQFGDANADHIVEEYERRLENLRTDRDRTISQGLGALGLRRKSPALPPPEFQPSKGRASTPSITSRDLVGNAPPGFIATAEVAPGTGSAVSWFKNRQKEKEEEQQRKMEKWNDVMLKRQQAMMEKAKAKEAKALQ